MCVCSFFIFRRWSDPETFMKRYTDPPPPPLYATVKHELHAGDFSPAGLCKVGQTLFSLNHWGGGVSAAWLGAAGCKRCWLVGPLGRFLAPSAKFL